MRQLCCDREAVGQWRVGGLFGWEEDAKLVSELNLKDVFKFIGFVQTSIYLLLLLLEACDLLHPISHIFYVVLLELVLQLSPVYLLAVSNLDFQLFLY